MKKYNTIRIPGYNPSLMGFAEKIGAAYWLHNRRGSAVYAVLAVNRPQWYIRALLVRGGFLAGNCLDRFISRFVRI